MRVFVDTNVLSDVLHADPKWSGWSTDLMAAHASGLSINPMIYADLGYRAESRAEVDEIVEGFGLRFLEIPREALFLATQVFRVYRERGGTRTAPQADIFIGAHAQTLSMPILTRDPGRYGTYFPEVTLIKPAT